MERGSRKSRYKAIVKRFRKKELQQYLEFLNLETHGKKPVLFDRVWKSLKNILHSYEELPVAIENIIRELNE
ncbi:hypothetical protein AVEN_115921-1 [Araneus ventricosus]|uniref:SAP domain-containing protein n=1 Tax=Araneus ventricosus TaxID=182803 RepID=A0A4Y2JNI5_ARAVE|nr:hypothetical protein AVEN_115921-1 [Araneus ventricosus]